MLRRIMLSFICGTIIPGLLFSFVPQSKTVSKAPTITVENDLNGNVPQIDVELYPQREQEPVYISVIENDGTVAVMELEQYVLGVVLGEMPASFESEALKAQAVAARTYALRCMEDGTHENGTVCKNFSCCQNYCDPDRYIAGGGLEEYVLKIRRAVHETKGLAAVYNGRPIFSVYFASSGGYTEDAAEVWGNAFPYLKSVESSGEMDKSYQNDTVRVTYTQFENKLGVQLSGSLQQSIGKIQYTAGGGVASVVIGGKKFSGVLLRSLFGLRSTMFQISAEKDAVTFVTNGYGHRVGMSQYGAQAMALDGNDYQAILKHYYQGIEVQQYPISGD